MVNFDDSHQNPAIKDENHPSATHGYTTLTSSTAVRTGCLTSDSFTLAQRICNIADRDAWDELYDRYTPYVKGYLRRFRLPAHLVEDIYHDSMTSFYQAVQSGSFNPQHKNKKDDPDQPGSKRHPIRPYLTTTVRNRAFTVMEQEAKAPKPPGHSDWVVPHMTESQLKEAEEKEWSRAILHQCMQIVRQEFDDRANYVFHLRMAEGRSAKEVAELIESSGSAVDMIVHRVKKRLREIYPEVESVY